MNFEKNNRGGWIVPDKTIFGENIVFPDFSELGNKCVLGDGCVLGNYCELKNVCELGNKCVLGNGCVLANGCVLGDECVLGNRCALGNGCVLGNECVLGNYCELRNVCEIGNRCVLGDECVLGNRCALGNGCVLGNECVLGDECIWLGVTVINWLTMSNIDGSGRQLKLVRHKNGVKIEAGCFCDDGKEFLQRAKLEEKQKYVAIVSAVVDALIGLNYGVSK